MTELWPHRAAILFSGGDSPGMNALLRDVARLGLNRHGAEIVGVKDGFAGMTRAVRRLESGELTLATLISEIDTHEGLLGVGRATQDLVRLDHVSVSGLLGRGGVMLGASRCQEFHDLAAARSGASDVFQPGGESVSQAGSPGLRAGPSPARGLALGRRPDPRRPVCGSRLASDHQPP